jgi:polyphosphate kinase
MRVISVAEASCALDAFFLVRVGGLEHSAMAHAPALVTTAGDFTDRCAFAFTGQLLPALQERGVWLLSPWNLRDPQRSSLDELFMEAVFPLLTPMSVDSGRPFPHISSLSLNLAAIIEDSSGRTKFVRIEVPRQLPRFLQLCESNLFVPIEECIAANLHHVLHGARVLAHHTFRVTRKLGVEAAGDLSGLVAGARRERVRQANRPIRLEVEAAMPPRLVSFLVGRVGVPESLTHAVRGRLDLSQAASLLRTEEVFRRFRPAPQL